MSSTQIISDTLIDNNNNNNNSKEIQAYLIQKFHKFPLYLGDNIIGRSVKCDVSLQDTSVSELHCILNITKNKYELKDILSTNGTYYEKKLNTNEFLCLKRNESIELINGINIRVGLINLKFEVIIDNEENNKVIERNNENKYDDYDVISSPEVEKKFEKKIINEDVTQYMPDDELTEEDEDDDDEDEEEKSKKINNTPQIIQPPPPPPPTTTPTTILNKLSKVYEETECDPYDVTDDDEEVPKVKFAKSTIIEDEPTQIDQDEPTQIMDEPTQIVTEEPTQYMDEPTQIDQDEPTQYMEEPTQIVGDEPTQIIGEEPTQYMDEPAQLIEDEPTQYMNDENDKSKLVDDDDDEETEEDEPKNSLQPIVENSTEYNESDTDTDTDDNSNNNTKLIIQNSANVQSSLSNHRSNSNIELTKLLEERKLNRNDSMSSEESQEMNYDNRQIVVEDEVIKLVLPSDFENGIENPISSNESNKDYDSHLNIKSNPPTIEESWNHISPISSIDQSKQSFRPLLGLRRFIINGDSDTDDNPTTTTTTLSSADTDNKILIEDKINDTNTENQGNIVLETDLIQEENIPVSENVNKDIQHGFVTTNIEIQQTKEKVEEILDTNETTTTPTITPTTTTTTTTISNRRGRKKKNDEINEVKVEEPKEETIVTTRGKRTRKEPESSETGSIQVKNKRGRSASSKSTVQNSKNKNNIEGDESEDKIEEEKDEKQEILNEDSNEGILQEIQRSIINPPKELNLSQSTEEKSSINTVLINNNFIVNNNIDNIVEIEKNKELTHEIQPSLTNTSTINSTSSTTTITTTTSTSKTTTKTSGRKRNIGQVQQSEENSSVIDSIENTNISPKSSVENKRSNRRGSSSTLLSTSTSSSSTTTTTTLHSPRENTDILVETNPICILLTGYLRDSRLEKMATTIGAEIVNDPSDRVTHCITTPELKRTPKLLMSINYGVKYIIKLDWLEDSAKFGRPILISLDNNSGSDNNSNNNKYLVNDNKKEILWNFNLISTLRKPRSCLPGLFSQLSFYVTKGVCGVNAPKEDEMKSIILSGGGNWLSRLPSTTSKSKKTVNVNDNRRPIIISSENVASEMVTSSILNYAKTGLGHGIYTIEFLFIAILRYEIDYEIGIIEEFRF